MKREECVGGSKEQQQGQNIGCLFSSSNLGWEHMKCFVCSITIIFYFGLKIIVEQYKMYALNKVKLYIRSPA